ncbi:hypothetical protein [Emcibacter sp.]|uniref:hypothetical protein n=1 Tax=Emcibacter sp. TaxID=1979954 RepID=UPI002AA83E09|nr:hypothetical protein [Emcibacter sp.]
MQLYMVVAFSIVIVVAVFCFLNYGADNVIFVGLSTAILAALGKILWDTYERRKKKRDIADIVLAEINNFREHTIANLKVLKDAVDGSRLLEKYQIEKLYYLSDVPITIKNEQISILPKNLMAEIMRMHVRFRNIDIEIRTFWRLSLSVKADERVRTDFQKMLMFKAVYLWMRCTTLLERLEMYRLHQDFPVDYPFSDRAIGNLSLKQVVSLWHVNKDHSGRSALLEEIREDIGDIDEEQILHEAELLVRESSKVPLLGTIFKEHGDNMRKKGIFNVSLTSEA